MGDGKGKWFEANSPSAAVWLYAKYVVGMVTAGLILCGVCKGLGAAWSYCCDSGDDSDESSEEDSDASSDSRPKRSRGKHRKGKNKKRTKKHKSKHKKRRN